jgi:hypothetical protein
MILKVAGLNRRSFSLNMDLNNNHNENNKRKFSKGYEKSHT